MRIARPVRLTLLALAASALAAPALAHPHVWVKARAELVFDAEGRVASVQHHWSFDDAYSAFAVEGLDADRDGRLSPEELAPLSRTFMESLVEWGYYSTLKAGGTRHDFAPPRAERMTFDKGALTLHFELPLQAATPPGRALVFMISDPTFFVEFSIADEADAVRAVGAPAGCLVAVTRPRPQARQDSAKLSERFFESLTAAASPSSPDGQLLANRATLACP